MFRFSTPKRAQRKRTRSSTRRRRLLAENLEVRRVLAASFGWDGPGLGSAQLTYYIANSPDSLSQSETDAAIETALAAWSSAADITFTETDQPGLRDSIDISFTNIDGVGGTLAQAYFPDDVNPARIAGDVQFDISDVWEVGNSRGRQAFDLVYVAVHEIGHSLGLDHTAVLGSVLTPFVSANQLFTTLQTADVLEIQELYAAADTSDVVDEPTDKVVDPTVDVENTDEEQIDDGGMVDDSDDGIDDNDNTAPGRFYVGLFGKAATSFIMRFDTDGDGSLSEDEVSERLWAKLGLLETDADADGMVTLVELDTALSAARQETFDKRDNDNDGLLSETEVSGRFWNKIVDADTDRDGGVSFDELEAFRAERIANQGGYDETEAHRHQNRRLARQHATDRVFATFGRSARRR